MKSKDVIYEVTYLIQPPQLGMLVLDEHLISETQYSLLKESIFTLTHTGNINVGTTKKHGVAFKAHTNNQNQINELIDAIFALSVDLVKYGIDFNDTGKSIPRPDLQKCLDNSMAYIMSASINTPKVLSNYFNTDEIVFPKKIDKHLKSIIDTNKKILDDIEDENRLGIKEEFDNGIKYISDTQFSGNQC